MRRLSFLCIVTLLSPAQAFSQDTLSMSIEQNRFLIVGVTVNDSITSRWIVDTGAGLEVVSRQFFDRIRHEARFAGTITGFPSIGTRVDLELYRIPSLQIGPMKKHGVIIAPYGGLDGLQTIDGILSLKFFEDRPFTLDFASQRVILETPASVEAIAQVAERIPVYPRSDRGIALDIFVPLIANGTVKLLAEFDTGTGIETMVSPYYLEALGIDTLSSTVRRRSFEDPDGRSQAMYIAQLASLELSHSDRIKGYDLAATFLQNFIHEAVIGWQLFRENLVTIDYPNRRILVR